MIFPIEHNGQIYDVVAVPNAYGHYNVVLEREIYGDLTTDDIDERGLPDVFTERLGWFTIDTAQEDGTEIKGSALYQWETQWARSLNEIVAKIVDAYRACSHGDATCLGGTKWQCDICGADFEREDEDEEQYIPDYEIPWGTPDSWIPDNPNEDGFTQRDFI